MSGRMEWKALSDLAPTNDLPNFRQRMMINVLYAIGYGHVWKPVHGTWSSFLFQRELPEAKVTAKQLGEIALDLYEKVNIGIAQQNNGMIERNAHLAAVGFAHSTVSDIKKIGRLNWKLISVPKPPKIISADSEVTNGRVLYTVSMTLFTEEAAELRDFAGNVMAGGMDEKKSITQNIIMLWDKASGWKIAGKFVPALKLDNKKQTK